VKLIESPDPQLRADTDVKLKMLECGVCATDRDLCNFQFGAAPPGEDHFVLGHESLAEVVEAGPSVVGWAPGDLAVIVVRHPCGPPLCEACAAGRQDFCASGGYREHGIKELHGFMRDFVVTAAGYLHRVPCDLRHIAVLAEPLTIAEKALSQWRSVETRLPWQRDARTAVVLGAGPVGLLGAMLFRLSGLRTWIYSREEDCELAETIGACYVSTAEASPGQLAERTGPIDFVYEAMGAPQVAFDVLQRLGANGLFLFTGAPWPDQPLAFDLKQLVLSMVIGNRMVGGTVNAAPAHFDDALAHLGAFEQQWPGAAAKLISARVPIVEFRDAIFGPGRLKKVVTL
jgi:threonine dehydrogenase-like Zn-dependent dehydrogenase